MEYWIHLFDGTGVIKLNSLRVSADGKEEVAESLVAYVDDALPELANGDYIVVISTESNCKAPFSSDEVSCRISKSDVGLKKI